MKKILALVLALVLVASLSRREIRDIDNFFQQAHTRSARGVVTDRVDNVVIFYSQKIAHIYAAAYAVPQLRGVFLHAV